MIDNYSDVLDQMRGYGLIVENLVIGKLTRCNAQNAKKKAGWYSLREVYLDKTQRDVIVGRYGINRGTDHGTQEITLSKKYVMSAQDKAVIAKRLAEAKKEEEIQRKKEIEDAALLSELIFFNSQPLSSFYD